MSEIIHGEALATLRGMPDHTFDACVTDPPYGLKFMGRRWDYEVPSVELWAEVMRVLKPGAHLVAFGGSRTYHRLACNIEDAGLELRDQLMWLYGSGYPKTKHVLKPAHEPIVLARKPFEGRLEDNIANVGTGALSIEACRLEYLSDADRASATPQGKTSGGVRPMPSLGKKLDRKEIKPHEPVGRWPANVIHDGSEEVLAEFDKYGNHACGKQPAGGLKRRNSGKHRNTFNRYGGLQVEPVALYGDQGSASRFFYAAKASPDERGSFNTHPTVKPLALMRYLVRLTVPVGGRVLDPFAGSGTTALACNKEERACVGIEREETFCEIARKRLAQRELFTPESVGA